MNLCKLLCPDIFQVSKFLHGPINPVQTIAERFSAREDATLFTMHDLVHDLARSVMADEFYLKGPNCRYACLIDCTKPLKSSATSPANIKALHIVDHPDDGLKDYQFHPDAYSKAVGLYMG
jgi:hypothetical protein